MYLFDFGLGYLLGGQELPAEPALFRFTQNEFGTIGALFGCSYRKMQCWISLLEHSGKMGTSPRHAERPFYSRDTGAICW
jgi:hypothetical protein